MTEYMTAERRNAVSTELLLRRLRKHHGVPVYPMPAVVIANPLVENYRNQLPAKLERCSTKFSKVTVAVCHEFGLSREQLLGDSRVVAFPRQVAMHLMADVFKNHDRMIAHLFRRDHTCVRLAKRKIPKLAADNKAFGRRLRNLTVAVRAAA